MSWKRKSNCAKGFIKFYLRTMKDSGFVLGVEMSGQSSVTSYSLSSWTQWFCWAICFLISHCQGLVTLSEDGSLKSRRTGTTMLSSPWLWQNPPWNQVDYLQCKLHLRLPDNRPRCCLDGSHNQQKLGKLRVSMATTLHRAWPTKCSMNAKDPDRGEKQHF